MGLSNQRVFIIFISFDFCMWENKASRNPTRYSTAVDKPKNLGVSGNRSYKNLYLKTVSKKCVKNSEL